MSQYLYEISPNQISCSKAQVMSMHRHGWHCQQWFTCEMQFYKNSQTFSRCIGSHGAGRSKVARYLTWLNKITQNWLEGRIQECGYNVIQGQYTSSLQNKVTGKSQPQLMTFNKTEIENKKICSLSTPGFNEIVVYRPLQKKNTLSKLIIKHQLKFQPKRNFLPCPLNKKSI